MANTSRNRNVTGVSPRSIPGGARSDNPTAGHGNRTVGGGPGSYGNTPRSGVKRTDAKPLQK